MFDIILENASVVDGTGRQAFNADIGITGERIEKMGNLEGAEAARTVDVSGKTVCPGFIDVHSHADLAFFREEHAKILTPLVTQGITTFIGGNCGMALSPITEHHKDGQRFTSRFSPRWISRRTSAGATWAVSWSTWTPRT